MRNLGFILTLLLFAATAPAEQKDEAPRFQSPDKKLEYRANGEEATIVKSDTGETVLKLEEASSSLALETGKILWAPDSRRFAFNYRSGGRYYTCSVYELTGTEWKALPDIEEKATAVSEMISRAEQRDRKRLGVGKNASRRRIMDKWAVRRWIDRDTLEVFAESSGSVVVDKKNEDVDYIGGAVLFTVKCDNRGGWKITRLRELSDADVEKMDKEDEARGEAD